MSALTQHHLDEMLTDMDFEVLDKAEDITYLISDLCRWRKNDPQPTHYIEVMWNHDLQHPRCFGIVIWRTNVSFNSEPTVSNNAWFIDVLRLPRDFLNTSCTANSPAVFGVTLASILRVIRFACFDAEDVSCAFRACFGFRGFDHLVDLGSCAMAAFSFDPQYIAKFSGANGFLNVLEVLVDTGFVSSFDWREHTRTQALVRQDPNSFSQRPLPDAVVYRYIFHMNSLVAIWQYYWHQSNVQFWSVEYSEQVLNRSDQRARQGITRAQQAGYHATLETQALP